MSDDSEDAREPLPREVLDNLPDVRDGLNRKERAILVALHEAQRDFPGRNVPTATLYGRVVEKVNLSVQEFQSILARMVAKPISGEGARKK